MNTYLTVSSFINCLAALLLIVNVVSSKRRNPVVTRFILFLFSLAGWAGAYGLWRISSSSEEAVIYCKILTAFSVFISVALYDFCLKLGGLTGRNSLVFGYVFGGVLSILICFDFVVDGVSAKHGHEFWPNAGVLMPVYLLFYSAYLTASAWILVVSCRSHLGGRASDALFVLLTCFVGFVGGATNFPLWYDIPIQPYGNGLVALYVILLGYGLYENRYLKVGLDIYRILVGASLSATAAFFYIVSFAFYQSFNGVSLSAEYLWNHALWALFISMLAFWGIPRLKLRVEKTLEGVFRSGRRSALSELNALPTRISDIAEEDAIASVVVETIIKSLGVDRVAVFRIEGFENDYCCVHSSLNFESDVEAIHLDVNSPIINGLSINPTCLILEQLYDEIDQDYYQALVQLRNKLDLSIIVPIFASHEIYGLILVGRPNQIRLWTEEESSVLFNIGAQIGLNFRTRDLERRSNEVDKLVALGTMAAGLAHEIRNPLVSVQTLATLVQAGKPLESVSSDFKDVLLRDVKRIGNIVEGVALYSQNQQSRKSPTNLLSIIRSSMEIYESVSKIAGVEIRLNSEIDESVVILASTDQLMQVFNNLIENALHALSGMPTPCVTIDVGLKSTRSRDRKSWVDVSVSDNGKGIPPSILPRIFDPFITSKDTGTRLEKHGMGLGLAISKRIVDNHNGAIVVSNNPSGGAKFVVSLKVFDSKGSDA